MLFGFIRLLAGKSLQLFKHQFQGNWGVCALKHSRGKSRSWYEGDTIVNPLTKFLSYINFRVLFFQGTVASDIPKCISTLRIYDA